MAVSPADFELYSRATGTPMPRTPQEQMQMAPMVYKFIQNRGYQNQKGFLGQAGDFLAKAALVGGGLALANQLIPYESGGGGGVTATESIDTDDGNLLTGSSPRGLLPPGRESGQIAVSPVNISPQTPVSRENVGTVGSIKTDLSNVVDRSDIWDSGEQSIATSQGFNRPGPAPRDLIEEVGSGPNYSRQVAAPTPANVVMAGGRSVVANPRVVGWDQEGDPIMKQPKAAFTDKDLQFPFPNRTNPGMAFIAASTEAPTTGIPGIDEVSVPVLTQLTGMHIPGIGQAVTTAGPYIAGLGRQAAGDIVDTARFAGSGLTYVAENLRPILAQGRADIGKGIRDLRQGYEDIGILGNQIGAAHNKYLVQPTQRLAGRIGLSLPTSASQQSAPLETGKESILFDHPDVAQSGTGSDEVQNNKNYILHGNVDQEGNLIKDLFEYTPENKGGVDRFGNTMPQGRVFGGKGNYFSPEGIYGGDPEMIGSVSNQRVKDQFISSAGIPQINEDLVGGDVVESSAPEEEAFHALKQFVRGLTGQDSPVEYEPDSELLDNIAAEVAEVQASNGAIPNPPNFEQSQRFKPKAQKIVGAGISEKTGRLNKGYEAGGGKGVESIGYRPDGYLEIDWHGKNEDKRTEGGYVFDDYVGSLKKDNRDALVRDTADPRFIRDEMSPAEREEYIKLGFREMRADADVYDALRDKKFGYGEGQVSPGKFAQRAKTGQGALLDFIDQNRDILRGE